MLTLIFSKEPKLLLKKAVGFRAVKTGDIIKLILNRNLSFQLNVGLDTLVPVSDNAERKKRTFIKTI